MKEVFVPSGCMLLRKVFVLSDCIMLREVFVLSDCIMLREVFVLSGFMAVLRKVFVLSGFMVVLREVFVLSSCMMLRKVFCTEQLHGVEGGICTEWLHDVAVLMLLVFMLVKFRGRDTDNDKYILEVDPEDDIRENVINYDEEGAGEPLSYLPWQNWCHFFLQSGRNGMIHCLPFPSKMCLMACLFHQKCVSWPVFSIKNVSHGLPFPSKMCAFVLVVWHSHSAELCHTTFYGAFTHWLELCSRVLLWTSPVFANGVSAPNEKQMCLKWEFVHI